MKRKHNPTKSPIQPVDNQKPSPFNPDGIGLELDKLTFEPKPISPGVFTGEVEFLSLLTKPNLRALETLKQLRSPEVHDGAATVRPMADSCKLEGITDMDACATTMGTSTIDSQPRYGQSYLQAISSPWIYSPDGTIAVRLHDITEDPPLPHNLLDWLLRHSFPLDESWECPEAVRTYFTECHQLTASQIPPNLLCCENCNFEDTHTGFRSTGLHVFKLLQTRYGDTIGIVGVALDPKGAPITGDGVTSSTYFLKDGYSARNVYLPEYEESTVGIAIDLHSALHLTKLTGLPTIATGTYSNLNLLAHIGDKPAGIVIVERDCYFFDAAVTTFKSSSFKNANTKFHLASFTSLAPKMSSNAE